MKLVDILAKELKVWPAGASHAYSSGHLARFADVNGRSVIGCFKLNYEPEDHQTAFVTLEQWKAAVAAVDALKAPAWDGEDLPPVGTVCEAKMPPRGVSVAIKEWTWRKVEVVRLNNGVRASEREVLVFDLENTAPAWVDELRPTRTAEQIEAEEREKEVVYVMSLMPRSIMTTTEVVQWMISNGYRKQVAK